MKNLEKVISGGQTGVDRAGLDAALAAGLPIGGWCPAGRLAEDGPIDAAYPLIETPSAEYHVRTEWNARNADATLIVAPGRLAGGSAYTERMAVKHGRPVAVVRPREKDIAVARAFIEKYGVRVLNVAGPRESTEPGIYAEARAFLERVFKNEDRGLRIED
ncbi:putative molybdenum carrier protein [bacterium]|nr:putative molybdenum carrier protein [bacterium]